MPSEYLLRLAIQEKPVFTLKECLQLADIGNLALEHQLLEDEDQSPDGLREEAASLLEPLLEVIPKHFRNDIRLFSKGDVELIGEALRCMKENLPLPDDSPHSTHTLESKGYLYLFAYEGQLRPVFPNELHPIWEAAQADEPLLEEIGRNRELLTYAGALANLYGVYEPEQLAVVWNQHKKEKITEHDAKQFLEDMLDFQEYYWMDFGMVVNDAIIMDDELDELLSEREGLPYIMPTKKLIAQYADEAEYDESRPELQKMLAFLKTVVPDDAKRRPDLDLEIIFSCTEEWAAQEVADMLAKYGFPLEDAAAVETFNRLYQALFENTRLWKLRGDTPAHYAQENNKRLVPFYLPSAVPRKVKKVGRNAPCPCGSGKKYKHCCGA